MDSAFMHRAIELAEKNMLAGAGGPFGAVVVHNDKIIAEGWNCVTSINDPTAHAEVQAIRAACQHLGQFSLAGCELYTSCEPCPMCLAASYWARLDRIYYAADQTDAAAIGFDDRHFYEQLGKPAAQRSLPVQQLLRDEAQQVMQRWLQKTDRISY